jgi:hypothetical protein
MARLSKGHIVGTTYWRYVSSEWNREKGDYAVLRRGGYVEEGEARRGRALRRSVWPPLESSPPACGRWRSGAYPLYVLRSQSLAWQRSIHDPAHIDPAPQIGVGVTHRAWEGAEERALRL